MSAINDTTSAEWIAAAAAALQLFRAGKDTLDIAMAFGLHESDVVRMLARARNLEAYLYQQVESVA